jgi:selenide,water dikinase
MFGLHPPSHVRVTLIARDLLTPYSGMLPGFVAGHYTLDNVHLDLAKLSRFGNVKLIHAAAESITYNDNGGGLVYCNGLEDPVRYDCLSIDIGSAPVKGDQVSHSSSSVIPVKPIANFTRFYQTLCEGWTSQSQKYTLCVAGGGAGGVELALSVQYRVILVTRGKTLMETHNHSSTNL